jgi:hypothetical protein
VHAHSLATSQEHIYPAQLLFFIVLNILTSQLLGNSCVGLCHRLISVFPPLAEGRICRVADPAVVDVKLLSFLVRIGDFRMGLCHGISRVGILLNGAHCCRVMAESRVGDSDIDVRRQWIARCDAEILF